MNKVTSIEMPAIDRVLVGWKAIAKAAGRSERTMRYHRQGMIDAGLLWRIPRRGRPVVAACLSGIKEYIAGIEPRGATRIEDLDVGKLKQAMREHSGHFAGIL
jgi:hypothetical protein